MSSDNYYRIFQLEGLFYPVQGFFLDDFPVALDSFHMARGGYGTLREACQYADLQNPEYGYQLDASALKPTDEALLDKFHALFNLHQPTASGVCEEDRHRFPCKTFQILEQEIDG